MYSEFYGILLRIFQCYYTKRKTNVFVFAAFYQLIFFIIQLSLL